LSLGNSPKGKALLQKFGDARVIFAANVNKINTSLKGQERTLMISDAAMYNLDPKKLSCKRRLEIKNLKGISVSCLCDGFVIIHVKEPDYDYVADTDKATEIITVLSSNFERLTGTKLQMFFSNKIEFRARKGKREAVFEKGNKSTFNKKGNSLLVMADAGQVAPPSAFASVLEYTKLKQSNSQPQQKPVIVRKDLRKQSTADK